MSAYTFRYEMAGIRAAGMTVITAHSGCEGTAANSRAHLEAAAASGAEVFEIDVRQEASGRLYLSHDLPADPSACPDFGAVLDTLAGTPGLMVNCDVKTPGLVTPVMRAAAARGLADRILFTGACNAEYEEIRALGGILWYSLWPSPTQEDDIRAAADTCRRIDCPYINLQYRMITEENLALVRAAGLEYSAWTVDDENAIRALLALGIANITTRRPTLALRLRDELQGTPAGRGAAHV